MQLFNLNLLSLSKSNYLRRYWSLRLKTWSCLEQYCFYLVIGIKKKNGIFIIEEKTKFSMLDDSPVYI